MSIGLDTSAAARIKWYEYGVRFGFGGIITVIAGLLANKFGPVLGGLFLAFPAIFPASATLVEKHEREIKRSAGITTSARGRQAAALDARGASIGSIGLATFAVVAWKLLPLLSAGLALFIALSSWLVVSLLIWRLSRTAFR
jgi:hypothetical protein